jgi:hypothetical protein
MAGGQNILFRLLGMVLWTVTLPVILTVIFVREIPTAKASEF